MQINQHILFAGFGLIIIFLAVAFWNQFIGFDLSNIVRMLGKGLVITTCALAFIYPILRLIEKS